MAKGSLASSCRHALETLGVSPLADEESPTVQATLRQIEVEIDNAKFNLSSRSILILGSRWFLFDLSRELSPRLGSTADLPSDFKTHMRDLQKRAVECASPPVDSPQSDNLEWLDPTCWNHVGDSVKKLCKTFPDHWNTINRAALTLTRMVFERQEPPIQRYLSKLARLKKSGDETALLLAIAIQKRGSAAPVGNRAQA